MKHEEFKIIVKGEELSYPMLRLVSVMFLCWLAGFIAGVL